jgi:ATP-dependent DNA helicase RecG
MSRPEILFSAFAPVASLPGCGPKLAKLIAGLAGGRVVDLWWHLPAGLIDRRFAPKVAEAPEGAICTLEVRIEKHVPPRHPRLPYKIVAADATGKVTLVFFRAKEPYLRGALPEGSIRLVSGKVEFFEGQPQMTHPDRIARPDEAATVKTVEPVYPLTGGLNLKPLGKIVASALEHAPELPEWLDPDQLALKQWQGWREALRAAHRPQEIADLAPETPARQRLAYDELLASQLALNLVRASMRRAPGRKIESDGRLVEKIKAALPYRLTDAQVKAFAEIAADLKSDRRMLRLLQGDVGSGKTVVALLAMMMAVESGGQAALMAPTELLTQQHFRTIEPLVAALAKTGETPVALLTQRIKGKARAELLAKIANGEVTMVIGTHALFQEDVVFHDLKLAVIDEQHRFGVHQRLMLAAKSGSQTAGVDMLVMTATPIPRTLALTAYGDMDISQLREKPPGRVPIDTRALPLNRLAEVIAAVERKLNQNERVYWVCPQIGENESGDPVAAEAAAVARHRDLAKRLGPRVGLLHGQMKSAERDRAMAAFSSGETGVLVATTVVEVGVDVPEATLMVIEHAERFGLAQLHQLRGRIGRGQKPGVCLLLYAQPLGPLAKARIKTLRETGDGFLIAEEDLRLRGAGEVLGTRQSGVPGFRLADLAAHADLLLAARDDAKLILQRDPQLRSPRGQALRVLLYLFERDAAVGYLKSG